MSPFDSAHPPLVRPGRDPVLDPGLGARSRPGSDLGSGRPASTDKIYLVGFMGSGKTTLARALAARLGWPAVDVDTLIEERERRPIAGIFAERGEAYFRDVERDVLCRLLGSRPAVVATGGGTFVAPDNRAAINADGVSIWIDVPFGELLERLPRDGRRPLARTRADMEQLFLARRYAYREAHLRLDATGTPVAELVERVLDSLGW